MAHNKQTITHIGRARYSFSRLVASYTKNAQYDWKMLEIVVTISGMETFGTKMIVSGRKQGKPFRYSYTMHDPAVDKYNSIQL